MIPETIEDLEKIEWCFIYHIGGLYVLYGYYEGEIHSYYTNEMYRVSYIPYKHLLLDVKIITELNNYWEKDLPYFDSVADFVKYINRNKIINSIIND
jgi:hypothetical protein